MTIGTDNVKIVFMGLGLNGHFLGWCSGSFPIGTKRPPIPIRSEPDNLIELIKSSVKIAILLQKAMGNCIAIC